MPKEERSKKFTNITSGVIKHTKEVEDYEKLLYF